MDLEEATQSADSFSEPPPRSDEDPYAGDRNPTVLATRDPSYVNVAPGIYINTTNLPRGFGSSQYHDPRLFQAIQQSCQAVGQIMERPVKQEEADALAYHFAKAVQISSWGSPIGATVGVILWRNGRDTLRFPGWTPNPEKYSAERFGRFTGRFARVMWQTSRMGAYGFLGSLLGQVFVSSYALTAGSAGRAMDPRLKEFTEKTRQMQKNGQSVDLMAGGRQMDRTAGPRDGETLDMARQRARVQRQQQQQRHDSGDDMSPTGGSFGTEYGNVGRQQQFDTELMSDGQTQQRDKYFERESQRREQSENAAREQRRQPLDDATPMAQDSSSKQTGSTWEQIRQRAASGPSQSSSRSAWGRKSETSSGNESSGSDSFSFSQGEEDKQLARSEAQKQFDARIDREREGRDFDDQQGRRGGWRS